MATTTTGNTGNRRTVNKGQKDAQKPQETAPVKAAQNLAPVAAPTVQKTAPTPARKKPVTHKDLTLSYMMNGIDSIRPMLNESNNPVDALDKVINTLKQGDQDTADLETLRAYYDDLNGVGQPGRRPVKIGDSREYTVQQQGEEGDLFVRIPLNTLGVQRGQKILASFAENQIKIDVVLS